MDYYDEYLERSLWGPSERLQAWLASRVVSEFVEQAGLSPSSSDLLEIGSGTGRIGVVAGELGFRSYTGVEPATALADYARAHHGLRILDEELPHLLSIPDGAFDAVISMHVIEHAPGYLDAREWLAEMTRCVSFGGYVAIVAPNYLDYKAFFWDADWSHGFPTTPARIAQILNDLQMEVTVATSMHLGRTGSVAAASARLLSLLIPTRLVDTITVRVIGRPLGSGLKIAMLWGLTFVVARKPQPPVAHASMPRQS